MNSGIDTSIEIRKLEDKKSFNEILKHNLSEKDKWIQTYPNHENWIKSVVAELNSNNYSRIVFGGFFREKGVDKFCSSVIIKKNQFANYLEIKNLIVFKFKGNDSTLLRTYQIQLIDYIKEFAQKRGFPKLVTELSKKKDRDLINIFLENEFAFNGSQQGRYNSSDEIVFLSYEVNQLYGYDPYDNYSSSLWILKKYLKCQKIEKIEEGVVLKSDQNKLLSAHSYEFYNGTVRTSAPEAKFNSKNILIILGDDFRSKNQGFGFLNSLEVNVADISKVYIFDYTDDRSASSLKNEGLDKNVTIFERQDLYKLMGYGKPEELVKYRRFDFKEVGGLLLLSNPALFPFDKANKILRDDRNAFIYIKLGDYGRFINESMPIVFAYYPEEKNRTSLRLWGIGRANPFTVFDINSIKDNYSDDYIDLNKTDDITKKKQVHTDGDYLFKEMFEQLIETSESEQEESIDYEEFEKTILWNKEQFNTHNRYNETNLVIALSIDIFHNLTETIYLENIISESEHIQVIDNVFDFYLSSKEVKKIYDLSKVDLKTTEVEVMPNEINFLYAYALPNDKVRVILDHDFIENIFQNDRIKLRSLMDTNFQKLQSSINNFEIIHFSGHGDDTGLMLVNANDQKSEIIPNAKLAELFKNAKKVKVVVLNSCYSENQAKLISTYGQYVVGFSNEISSESSIDFSKQFYIGFNDQVRFGYFRGIRAGKEKFLKEFPTHANLITIWKNGNQILNT